jgi:hypothetical protein
VAIVTVIVTLRGKMPCKRRLSVSGVTAAVAICVATMPPILNRDARPAGAAAPAIVKPSPSALRTVRARTAEEAPLFNPSDKLIRTLPANSYVEVQCWYGGDAPQHWRSDGIEYHVVVPNAGHIPDPYLTFVGSRANLPACKPRTPGH